MIALVEDTIIFHLSILPFSKVDEVEVRKYLRTLDQETVFKFETFTSTPTGARKVLAHIKKQRG